MKSTPCPLLGPEGQAGFYRQMAQFDQRYTHEIEPLLGQIRRPVLILWGEEYRWLPLSRGKRLNQAIAGSEFRQVPNAGPLVLQEELNARLANPRLIRATENLFRYEGEFGHEIVFVFEAGFEDTRLYQQEELICSTCGVVRREARGPSDLWRERSRFRS